MEITFRVINSHTRSLDYGSTESVKSVVSGDVSCGTIQAGV